MRARWARPGSLMCATASALALVTGFDATASAANGTGAKTPCPLTAEGASKIMDRKLARVNGFGYFCVFGASTVSVAVGKFPGPGDPSTLPAARALFAKQRHVHLLPRPSWGKDAFLACKTVGSFGFSNLYCYAETPRFKVAFSGQIPELTNPKAVRIGDALVRAVWAGAPSLRP